MGVVLFWFPEDGEDVVGGQLARVTALGLTAGAVIFVPEGAAFRPEVSGYHVGDAAGQNSQLVGTGLEPQPDPSRGFVGESTVFAPEDTGGVTAQTAPSGFEPQADPALGFVGKESVLAPEANPTVVPTTSPSGADPQPDPATVFEDKESSYEGSRE